MLRVRIKRTENIYTFPKTHYVATLKPHLFFGCTGNTFAGIENFPSLTLVMEILKWLAILLEILEWLTILLLIRIAHAIRE